MRFLLCMHATRSKSGKIGEMLQLEIYEKQENRSKRGETGRKLQSEIYEKQENRSKSGEIGGDAPTRS